MSSKKNIIRVAATWLLASTILLTSSCSVFESLFGASRDDNGTLKGEAKISIFDAKVGDCLVGFLESGDEISTVTATPCTNKHDAEVYAVVTTTTTNASNTDWGEEYCYTQFAPYVGIDWDDSSLDYFFVYPDAGSKGTTVVCIVVEQGVSDAIGSVKGSQK
jgi:hypothetical protein